MSTHDAPPIVPHALAVVDVRQAAQLMNVSPTTLYRQLHEMPPRVRLSTRRYGWRTADLVRWLEERK